MFLVGLGLVFFFFLCYSDLCSMFGKLLLVVDMKRLLLNELYSRAGFEEVFRWKLLQK